MSRVAQGAARAREPAPPDPPRVLSIRDVMRALRKSHETVLALVEAGTLRTIQLGSRRMVVAASVDELLGTTPAASQEVIEQAVNARVAHALRQVADALEAREVIQELDATRGQGRGQMTSLEAQRSQRLMSRRQV